MLGQAAGFALLAAVSPTALLVMAVLPGSDNPGRTALMYVAGAILMASSPGSPRARRRGPLFSIAGTVLVVDGALGVWR